MVSVSLAGGMAWMARSFSCSSYTLLLLLALPCICIPLHRCPLLLLQLLPPSAADTSAPSPSACSAASLVSPLSPEQHAKCTRRAKEPCPLPHSSNSPHPEGGGQNLDVLGGILVYNFSLILGKNAPNSLIITQKYSL